MGSFVRFLEILSSSTKGLTAKMSKTKNNLRRKFSKASSSHGVGEGGRWRGADLASNDLCIVVLQLDFFLHAIVVLLLTVFTRISFSL